MTRARLRRSLIAALGVVGLLAGAAAPASAGRVGDVSFDIGLLRPLSFVRMVVGAPTFVVAWPFLIMDGSGSEEGWDVFVVGPYEDTFTRELGDF